MSNKFKKKKKKIRIKKDTCTHCVNCSTVYMDMEAARIWKQPRCPLKDEWIKKCGTDIQWNITQLVKGMHLSQFY